MSATVPRDVLIAAVERAIDSNVSLLVLSGGNITASKFHEHQPAVRRALAEQAVDAAAAAERDYLTDPTCLGCGAECEAHRRAGTGNVDDCTCVCN